MYKVQFDDLELPRPEVNLEVGSGSHAVQTAEIMKRFEPVVLERRPDLVLVVGDTNSTMSCALVAAKLNVPVAHVEAGLRSFDRQMPEEINRVVTDAISDLLFVSERSGLENLRREGVPDKNVFFVGNVMIDTLLRHRERAQQSDVLKRLGVRTKEYAVLTLHRPSNVDDPQALSRLLDAMKDIQATSSSSSALPIVFPVHPRTVERLKSFGLMPTVESMPNFRLTEPLGYLDFLKLMSDAKLVLTDSGGLQEETTILRVPCLTLRDNTERPATVEAGLNQLVGNDPARIREGLRRILENRLTAGSPPEKWDGHAGERIADVLAQTAAGSRIKR
jgi:UDP-N-acetylglucosamine 2-epimerase (non-hydrolysing)